MRDTTAKKHKDARALYEEWSKKTYKGVRIYSNAYIFIKIGEEVYLNPKTVERILFSKT